MGARELQEQDVEQERESAHLLRDRLRAEHHRRDRVPHRHVGGDVDLLRRMTHRPPHRLVDEGVDMLDDADRPEKGGNEDDGPRGDGEHRDDRGGQRPEGDEWYGALVGALLARDHQGAEEHEAPDQRADREQQQAEVEVRGRLHRHVGSEHHGGLALQHRHVDHHRADQHQPEGGPRDARRREAGVEQHRRCEVQNRHLEEDDPDQQHVESVRGEREVEPVRGQEVHRRPAGERHQQPEQSADGEEHHRGDCVRLDQVLRREVDLESGGGTGAKRFGHRAPSSLLTVG